MASATFKMSNADEIRTTRGTSFLLYGPSASRKTRTLGSMPDESVTLHISLDSGSNSASDAAKLLGNTKAVHKVTSPTSLKELNDVIIALHTNSAYKDKVDNVVVDNLVVIASWVQSFVAASPRYKKDALHVEDAVTDDTSKQAAGSKMMPYYGDVQRVTRELIEKILQITNNYNVFVLAGETISVNEVGSPITTVLVNGPKSITPITSMFSEVYRTTFTEGDFDSSDHTATFFKVSTHKNPLTGSSVFCKTRNIKDLEQLKLNKIPADFNHILSDVIGYVWKKSRVKEVVEKEKTK